VLSTQQGIGTFITREPVRADEAERQRQLSQLVSEFMARAGARGFAAAEVIDRIQEFVEQGRQS
jgi:GntR family transcriptional regulator